MIYDSRQLDAYLAAHYRAHLRPHGPIRLTGLGNGTTRLDEWPESLGKPPTPTEVEAWDPPSPGPSKAAEIDDALAEALAASTAATRAAASVDLLAKMHAALRERGIL